MTSFSPCLLHMRGKGLGPLRLTSGSQPLPHSSNNCLWQYILDVKTTNGVLIWKIPDIRRRYRDAVDRRTISLYSPPFYTSPHGYRMCIRTYLNGDGIGKGTHLSIFFVVMRSEHDNLLNWPFKQSVRFTLINQKNPGGSITEAIVPDLKSPSFQKPDNDMNIASGFPKFSNQSLLQDKNFTVVRCQVTSKRLINTDSLEYSFVQGRR